MTDKRVAIIIVTHNARKYLVDCLSCLRILDFPKSQTRVIVVDNHSQDSTVEYIKKEFPEVYLIENKQNLGFAQGNNIGIQYAMHNDIDFVYLLNQDTSADPKFLTQAMAVMEKNLNTAAVQSRLMYFDKKNIVNSIGNRIHFLGLGYAGGNGTPYSQYSYRREGADILYPSGAACLLRISALKDIGIFFEEFFMYHEDLDLGWRLWLSGYRCLLAPDSIVYHKYEFSRSITKYYFMERNRYLAIFENYKLATIFFIFPALIFFDIAVFLQSFLKGFWREEVRAKLYFFNLKNWKKISLRRVWVQERRKVRDRDILLRMTGTIQFQEKENFFLKYIFNPLSNIYFTFLKLIIFW